MLVSLPMNSVHLHGYWRSSGVYRVRIALLLKGIPYSYTAVNLLAGEQRAPAYLAVNPMGLVPALEVEGALYTESVAVLELLDELHPEPKLYPGDAGDRARVRALVETINAGTQPLHNLRVVQAMAGTAEEKEAYTQGVISGGLTAFQALVLRFEQLRGPEMSGPFCYGTAPTAADILLVPQLYAARRFKTDLRPFSRLLQAEAAMKALPAVAAAAPELQPDFPGA